MNFVNIIFLSIKNNKYLKGVLTYFNPGTNMILKNVLNIKSCSIVPQCRLISSSTASITRAHRNVVARTYPTIVVLPDGSSFNIRYHEPRKILVLPLDISTLSEADRKARIDSRKPKQKIRVEEELEDTYSAKKYIKFIKKK